jgi:hypothetical protein
LASLAPGLWRCLSAAWLRSRAERVPRQRSQRKSRRRLLGEAAAWPSATRPSPSPTPQRYARQTTSPSPVGDEATGVEMRTVTSRGFAREFVCPLTPSPLRFTLQGNICIEPKTRHGLGFREMALDKAPRSREGTAPPIKADIKEATLARLFFRLRLSPGVLTARVPREDCFAQLRCARRLRQGHGDGDGYCANAANAKQCGGEKVPVLLASEY